MNDAVEQVRTQYDEVPYASHPFPQTAPEHLAAIAHLFGLDAPAVATARVLELGCSSGGNLIPLAVRHPRARALGLDLSGVQIRQGLERVAALGLANLELREADLGAIDSAALGEFDYIVCHGVYSWVPAHVQDAILRICRQNLAPTGIAYLSYNTYPGWKAKEIVRDAMMLRGNPRSHPSERLSFARGMVEFLQQVARKDSVLAKALEENAPMLRTSQDYYLLHEYLEAFNAPCYFQQLLERAGAHGLAYLAEAEPAGMFVANYAREVAEPLLKECGHSQVLLEQYLDFVVNRSFRETLLVHAGQAPAIRYRLDRDRLRSLHFAANLPCRDGSTRLDHGDQDYGLAGQPGVSTSQPVVKRALDLLTLAWPGTMAAGDLATRALIDGDGADEAASRARVEDLLEHLVTHGLARYRLEPVHSRDPGERPCISLPIRQTAELARGDGDASTFNAWHESVALTAVDRWLLPALDGSLDRAALIEALLGHVAQGRVTFMRDGQPVTLADQQAVHAAEHVDALLARLRHLKLACEA